jgi:hypothetical protein
MLAVTPRAALGAGSQSAQRGVRVEQEPTGHPAPVGAVAWGAVVHQIAGAKGPQIAGTATPVMRSVARTLSPSTSAAKTARRASLDRVGKGPCLPETIDHHALARAMRAYRFDL